jgi:hypothetical protein
VTFLSESTFKKGDCSSSTASACFKASSKTVSPVLLSKSANTIVSFSVSGAALATDAVLQRHAVQELHDDERLTILLSDLMNRADVRMVERGRCTRLAAEAFERLCVLG